MNIKPSRAAMRSIAKCKPIKRLPETDAEYARILESVGERMPRSGRPRKGERAETVVMHVRIPVRTYVEFRKVAHRKHTVPNRLVQLFVAKASQGVA